MWGEHESMMSRGDDFWSLSMLGGGWLMFFGLILGTALVVLLVVFFVRQTTHPSGSGAGVAQIPSAALPPTAEPPVEILKRRYASGEIDREEYFQRLGDL